MVATRSPNFVALCFGVRFQPEEIKHKRGLPKVTRSDNGKEFCGRAMAIWAHENNVALRFIEPGARAWSSRIGEGTTTKIVRKDMVEAAGIEPAR